MKTVEVNKFDPIRTEIEDEEEFLAIEERQRLEVVPGLIKQIMNENLVQCPKSACAFSSKRPLTLVKHAQGHRDCPLCGKSSYGERNPSTWLKQHFRKEHRKAIKCKFCQRDDFKYLSHLKSHKVYCSKKYEAKEKVKQWIIDRQIKKCLL